MSVHLTLEKTKSGLKISIPICAQSSFYQWWEVFAKKNSLYNIGQMGYGHALDNETLIEFVDELEFMYKNLDDVEYFDKDDIEKICSNYPPNLNRPLALTTFVKSPIPCQISAIYTATHNLVCSMEPPAFRGWLKKQWKMK